MSFRPVFLLATAVLYITGSPLTGQAHDICMDPVTKKYGVCYADTIRVPQIYDFGQYINSFEFILAKDNKYGVVDRYGTFIIDMIYDHIWEFTEMPNQLLVQQGKKYGIINLKGKIVVPLYELQAGEINTFHIDQHLSYAKKENDYQVINEGKMAIYNIQGKLLFDFIYPFVQDILVQPADPQKKPYYIFLVGGAGNYSFVDIKNKPIFPGIIANNLYSVYHAWGEHTKVIRRNDQMNLINLETGALLNKDEMSNLLEPFNLVQDIEDKMGAIGADGTMRIPCIYNNMIELPEVEYLIVELNGKKGLIDYDGKLLLDPIYEEVAEICFDGMDPTRFPFAVDNGKWQAIFEHDKTKEKLVQKTGFQFSSISCFELTQEGLKAYLTDSTGKKGLLLPDGTIKMDN
jgi:hypothetical protein